MVTRHDVMLREATLSVVRGHIMKNGLPAEGFEVALTPLDANQASNGNETADMLRGMASRFLRDQSNDEGEFEIEEVAAGQYRLEVRKGGGRSGRGGRGGFGGGFGGSGGSALFSQEVVVQGGQPVYLQIPLATGMVTGTLTLAVPIEGERQGPRVFLIPAALRDTATEDPRAAMRSALSGQVEGNQFRIEDVAAGAYVLVVQARDHKRYTADVQVGRSTVNHAVVLEKADPADPNAANQPGSGQPGAGGRRGGAGNGPGSGPGANPNGTGGPGNRGPGSGQGNNPGNGGRGPAGGQGRREGGGAGGRGPVGTDANGSRRGRG
jgi:hypothetical protein